MQLSSKSYGRQINTVHDEYLDKLKKLQDQYDEETNHGINRLKQREWSRKITLELKKFTE